MAQKTTEKGEGEERERCALEYGLMGVGCVGGGGGAAKTFLHGDGSVS